MSARPPVSLADVLTAFAVMKPETPEARIGLAKALGFEYRPVSEKVVEQESETPEPK